MIRGSVTLSCAIAPHPSCFIKYKRCDKLNNLFLAVVAGLLMFVLPETHRKVLPTTLDEGEKFGITETEDLKLTEDETKKLTES